jgi:hypothetical protein
MDHPDRDVYGQPIAATPTQRCIACGMLTMNWLQQGRAQADRRHPHI